MNEVMPEQEKVVTSELVVSLYNELSEKGLKIWLDGGWGVDAIIGVQTRPHGDVDLIVQKKDVGGLNAFFTEKGYAEVPRDDSRWWNYVLGDENGNEVDVHVIEIDEEGNGIYGPVENGDAYPAQALTATGTIDGVKVNCLSPEYQLESHTGYEIRVKDINDVKAICDKYGLKAPEVYAGRF